MPILNTTNCYNAPIELARPVGLDILPGDWIDRLANLVISAPDAKAEFLANLNVHLGASYSQREQLRILLKQVYQYLTREDVSSHLKQPIITIIPDGIEQCSQGYHNRIQNIVMTMGVPTTVQSLVSLYRHDIVDGVARVLSDDVHSHNDVFRAAHRFGVNPINQDDPYGGWFDGVDVDARLQQAFDDKYTFMSVINDLEARFRGKLGDRGYIGHLDGDDANYGQVAIDSFVELVQAYFPDVETGDIVVMSDDYSRYIDINWGTIKARMFRDVIALNYFTLTHAEQFVINYMTEVLEQEYAPISIESLPAGFYQFFAGVEDLTQAIKFIDKFTDEQKTEMVFSFSQTRDLTAKDLVALSNVLSGEQLYDFLATRYGLSNLSEKFDNAGELAKILAKLNNQNAMELILALGQSYLRRICQTREGFSLIFAALSVDSVYLFNDIMGESHDVQFLLSQLDNLAYAFKHISTEHVKAVIDILGQAHFSCAVQSPYEFAMLLSGLNQQKTREVCLSLGHAKIRNWVRTRFNIRDLVDTCDEEQLRIIYEIIGDDAVNSIIPDFTALKDFIRYDLYSSQCAVKFLLSFNVEKLKQLFCTVENLTETLQLGKLDDNDLERFFARIGKEHFSNLVKSSQDLQNILTYLSTEKKYYVSNELFSKEQLRPLINYQNLRALLAGQPVDNRQRLLNDIITTKHASGVIGTFVQLNDIIGLLGSDFSSELISKINFDKLIASENYPSNIIKLMSQLSTEQRAGLVKQIKSSEQALAQLRSLFLNKINILDNICDQDITNGLIELLGAGFIASNKVRSLLDMTRLAANMTSEQRREFANELRSQGVIQKKNLIRGPFELKSFLGSENQTDCQLLLEAMGTDRLKGLIWDSESLIDLLTILDNNKKQGKYDSSQLNSLIAHHKFKLLKLGSVEIAIGVVSFAATGIAAAVLIIPSVGFLILGTASLTSSAVMLTTGVAVGSGLVSACTLVTGWYDFSQRSNITELENKTCEPVLKITKGLRS